MTFVCGIVLHVTLTPLSGIPIPNNRAFLCSDMMTLRYVAVTLQTFMITSNLFVLPNPLWPKLRWNVLLLGINVVMFTNLLLEKQRANQLPEELEALYHTGHFEKEVRTLKHICMHRGIAAAIFRRVLFILYHLSFNLR